MVEERRGFLVPREEQSRHCRAGQPYWANQRPYRWQIDLKIRSVIWDIGTRVFTSVDRRWPFSGGLNNDSNTKHTSGWIFNALLDNIGVKMTHLKRWYIFVKTCQQSRLEAVNYQSATSDWWLKVHQLQGHQTMLQVRVLIPASLAFQGHLRLTPYGPWRSACWWSSKSDFYQINYWLTLVHWRRHPGPR